MKSHLVLERGSGQGCPSFTLRFLLDFSLHQGNHYLESLLILYIKQPHSSHCVVSASVLNAAPQAPQALRRERTLQPKELEWAASGSVCSPRKWGEPFPPRWGVETESRLWKCPAQGECPSVPQMGAASSVLRVVRTRDEVSDAPFPGVVQAPSTAFFPSSFSPRPAPPQASVSPPSCPGCLCTLLCLCVL